MTDPAEETDDWTRVGAALVLLAAVIHLALGIAAIAGVDGLEANVAEIESNPDFGQLYFALGTWGWILTTLGLAEGAAGALAWRRTPNGWLTGLLVAFLGFGISFFALAIFRVPALVTIGLLLVATFLLAYHSRHSP